MPVKLIETHLLQLREINGTSFVRRSKSIGRDKGWGIVLYFMQDI
jgi:hypothetical protein